MSSDIQQQATFENVQDGISVGENGSSDEVSSQKLSPLKEGRVFKKAKRTMRKSESEDEVLSPTGLGPNANGHSKNSRKSKSSRGRGLPKKGKDYLSLYLKTSALSSIK